MAAGAAVICGLDLGFHLTGFCVGGGADIPLAGAWRFPDVGSDLGELGKQFGHRFSALVFEHGVTHVVYEAPFLDRYRDKVMSLRKRFGMDMVLETLCCDRFNIVCEEEPFGQIKKELAGHFGAKKADMIYAAEKIGVQLPDILAHGREDAADAVGPWLIGIRHYAKQYLAAWDQRLYSAKGALL